jgi:hypothetical protein
MFIVVVVAPWERFSLIPQFRFDGIKADQSLLSAYEVHIKPSVAWAFIVI